MMTTAIVLEGPEKLALRELPLVPMGAAQIVVDVEWSAVSTGTERLLWSGQMPPFPGMGYPLVPGYESVESSTPMHPRACRWEIASSCLARAATGR
jgi:3-hydroxyethyl bacteriochlorophyllide a dehydrogenase